MVQVSINFSNKAFYTLITVVSLLVISGVVIAYNSNLQPSVFGHTVNEIEFIKADGTTQSLSDYIKDIVDQKLVGGAVNCPSTPSYDSSTPLSKTNNYAAITLPEPCIQETGCVFIQEIYSSKGQVKRTPISFNQDFDPLKPNDPALWWSSYSTSGQYKNGDNNYAKITSVYNGIGIYDDYVSGSYSEKSPTQITARDTTTSYGQTIYICTLS